MLSVWSALVAAVAALAGVVLGQWLQGRRDYAQYRREVQAESRRSMREDRTRFVEERRRVYADFVDKLHQTERIIDAIDMAHDQGSVSADAWAGEPFPEWVSTDLHDRYESLYRELAQRYSYFELIAPDDVIKAAFSSLEAWDVVGRDALFGKFDMARLRDARSELIRKMKADLDMPIDTLTPRREG